MKILKLTALLFFFLLQNAHSQTHFGLMLSAGTSDIMKKDIKSSRTLGGDFRNVFAYSLGAYSTTQLFDPLSVDVNLLFSKKGGYQTHFFQDGMQKLYFKMHYIDLPVILHYNFHKNIKIGIGFNQSLLLFNYLHETVSNNSGNLKGVTKAYDFGYLADIQVKLFKSLSIGGRLNRSISSWNTGKYDPYISTFRHRSWLLYLQYELL
jgi:hypothetical protein